MYTKYQEQLDNVKKLKGLRDSVRWLAPVAAYGVATFSIITLSLIFAQTVNSVFVDPVMKMIGAGAAIIVGASSVVFLVFKNDLLKSHDQFIVACVFVGVEFSLLTLGAAYAFGRALGWYFDPFVVSLTHIAVIATFPVVAIEWIVVLALDPDAKEKRSHKHMQSDLSETERTTRESFLMSDPVVDIRQAASLAQVISDEMSRLPKEQRGLFVALLRKRHGEEYNGVPLLLGDEVDSHRNPKVASIPMNSDGIPMSEMTTDEENGHRPKVKR